MNGDKGADLKGLSVTHPIMGVRRKDRKEDSDTFEGLESHTFGGSPNDLQLQFKYLKVRTQKGLFPWKKL